MARFSLRFIQINSSNGKCYTNYERVLSEWKAFSQSIYTAWKSINSPHRIAPHLRSFYTFMHFIHAWFSFPAVSVCCFQFSACAMLRRVFHPLQHQHHQYHQQLHNHASFNWKLMMVEKKVYIQSSNKTTWVLLWKCTSNWTLAEENSGLSGTIAA